MPAHCRENYFKKPKYIIVYDYQTKAFKEKKKEFFNTLFLKKKMAWIKIKGQTEHEDQLGVFHIWTIRLPVRKV